MSTRQLTGNSAFAKKTAASAGGNGKSEPRPKVLRGCRLITRIQSFWRPCTKLAVAVALIFTTSMAHAKESILYGGGPLYNDAAVHRDMLRASGFTMIVIWTIHVYWDGDLVLNDHKIIDDGIYVGRSAWPSEVAAFKSGPTSVGRIEIAVGSAGVPDFENIETLIDSQGTGTNSALYRNFKALRDAVPAIDAVSFDDESNYDVDSSVAFALMLNDLGYKVSLCPYQKSIHWSTVYSQVQNQRPGSIDRIDLQCYAGGSGNTPSQWNQYFGGLRVTPGLWNYPKTGRQPQHVQNQLISWNAQSEIAGGFMWLLDDMLPVQDQFPVSSWATAINNALNIVIPAPPPNTDPANLITANSGFENGPYGWFTVGGDIDSTQASEGSQSARLVSSGAGNPGEWRSAYGNLTTGEIYRLTFDYRTASGATGSPQVRFRFYGEGALKGEAQRALDVTDGTWKSVAIDVSLPADAEYFEVECSVSRYGVFSGTVWLDKVAVTPLALAAGGASAGTLLPSSTGTQAAQGATMGVRFTSSSATNVINYLGVFDSDGDGLNISHQVGLYELIGGVYTLQGSVTVPAGTAAPLYNGYRWVKLATPVTLSNLSTTVYLVAADNTWYSGDNWGYIDPLIADSVIGTLPAASATLWTDSSALPDPSFNIQWEGPACNNANIATSISADEVLLPVSTASRDAQGASMGVRFTSASADTVINCLGVFDSDGDGLNISHQVGLYELIGGVYTLQGSVTVPAGTAAPLYNGYRWVKLATPVTLSNLSTTVYLVAADNTWYSGDNWGYVNGSLANTSIGMLSDAFPAVWTDSATLPSVFNITWQENQAFNNANIATAIRERVLTWDNGASSMSWNTSGANWTGLTWNNGNPDQAVFGSSGVGTVNLTEPVTAGSLTFNSAGYTLAGSTLALTGFIAVNADAVISSTISSGTLNKGGTGTLTLTAANTYGGNTRIHKGTLAVSGNGCLGGGFYAGTIANNGALSYSSSAAQTLSGVISGTGTVTQAGSGTLTLGGANTYSGATVVNSGTLKLTQAQGLSADSAVFLASGAVLNLDFTGTDTVRSMKVGERQLSRGVLYDASRLPGVITGGGSIWTREGPLPSGTLIRLF